MSGLAGRTAVVTGGATGIGQAIARELSALGAAVVIGSRTRERGEAMAAELVGRGGRAMFVATDVTRSREVEALIAAAVETFGGLDVLVNNSGIEEPEGPEGPSEDGWDRLFDVNVKGPWLGCRAALPHLLRSRGVILNVASMAGLVGVANGVGYAATKAAIVSMTRSLALTYAEQGVRVNSVCPGPIMTDMTLAEWDLVGDHAEGRERALSVIPARRIGEPEEVAKLAAFLVSDDAAFITGANVPIDGGKTAGLMATSRYRW